MNNNTIQRQRAVCEKYKADFLPCLYDQKVGIALSARDHIYPINGLRLRPEESTTGWFIWGGVGELSKDPDFFKPLHVAHLDEWCPEVVAYLGLAPGWRFLVTPSYEDVWFDPSLLE